jgi:hypothetical protein
MVWGVFKGKKVSVRDFIASARSDASTFFNGAATLGGSKLSSCLSAMPAKSVSSASWDASATSFRSLVTLSALSVSFFYPSVTFCHPSVSFSTSSATDVMEKAADISSKAADDLEKASDGAGKATDMPKKETNLSGKPDKEWGNASSRSIEANDDPTGALRA